MTDEIQRSISPEHEKGNERKNGSGKKGTYFALSPTLNIKKSSQCLLKYFLHVSLREFSYLTRQSSVVSFLWVS